MKLRFECKLIMTEDVDVAMEDVYPADVVAKNLIDDLKESMTSTGTVVVEDVNMTIEGR